MPRLHLKPTESEYLDMRPAHGIVQSSQNYFNVQSGLRKTGLVDNKVKESI